MIRNGRPWIVRIDRRFGRSQRNRSHGLTKGGGGNGGRKGRGGGGSWHVRIGRPAGQRVISGRRRGEVGGRVDGVEGGGAGGGGDGGVGGAGGSGGGGVGGTGGAGRTAEVVEMNGGEGRDGIQGTKVPKGMMMRRPRRGREELQVDEGANVTAAGLAGGERQGRAESEAHAGGVQVASLTVIIPGLVV